MNIESKIGAYLNEKMPVLFYNSIKKTYLLLYAYGFKLLDSLFILLFTIPCRLNAKRPPIAKSVVLVVTNVNPRVIKMGYGLKSAGWYVVLLYLNDFKFDSTLSFDETHQYNTRYTALLEALKYTPIAFHIFSSWYFDVAYLFIKCKPGKIVFDDYDVLAGIVKEEFVKNNYPKQMEKERFCLENCDGLCCRDYETEWAEKKLGYRIKGERILLFDSCFGIEKKERRKENRNSIHVVYCGGMNIEKYTPPERMGTCIGLFLARSFSKQNIHFHLYPPIGEFLKSDQSSLENKFMDIYSDYVDFEKRTKYFHLHYPVPYNQLLDELRQYDFGILISNQAIDVLDNDYRYERQNKYMMPNKIFDYIDAGLVPIVHSNTEFVSAVLDRYNIRVDAKKEYFEDKGYKLSEFLTPEMKENLETAKKELSISNQIHRLVDFYNRI